jgi:beta-lactamase regulating signal transducer with metallopeptidase domain
MNALLHASVSDFWSLAGWTMVHFLWLGAIVAAVATVARIALRSASPNARYAVAIGSLIALSALPPATAIWLFKHLPPTQVLTAETPAVAAQISAPIISASAPGSAGGDLAVAAQTSPASALPPLSNPRPSRGLPALPTDPSPSGSPSTLDARLSTLIAYLPWLWLIGTPLTFALLVSGVVGTRRLRRSSHAIESDPIVELLVHLASSLRITRRVTVAVCDRIASPVLIGILRPMILLPPAAITGWSPDELEMVLLHELAHVRRWDNLVNLLQRGVESLLFFHPAVWLISSWARGEREACCDATVVARTNRPHAYAELLVAFAAQLPRSVLFHPAATSAMAAGPLRSRIRQILKLEEDPMLVSGKSLALVLASLLAVVTFAVLYIPTVGRAEPSATESTEHTEKDKSETTAERNEKSNITSEKSHSEARSVNKESQNANDANTTAAAKESDQTRFEHFESSLKSIELDIAVFNDSAGYAHQLEPVYENLIDHHSLNLWGLKVNPKSPDAERYHLTAAPTCIVFRNGQEIARLAPIKDGEQLKQLVELAAGARKVTVKPDGSIVADGLELSDATPRAAESEKHGASNPSAKFPSLEEQKLADLAYKRLGLELEPIGDADLKRVKALGYDGGVAVASGSAGVGEHGDRMIRPGDILVGLGVWPTTDMKSVAEILTRPEITELNPVKFYVIRDLSTSNGPPELHDVVLNGRVEVHVAPPAGLFTSSGFGPGASESSPYQLPASTPAPKAEPKANADPYAFPPAVTAPSPIQTMLTEASKQLEDALKRKSDAMEKRSAAKTDEDVEKTKRDLDAANKQLEEAKRQFQEAKRQREKLDTENTPKETSKQHAIWDSSSSKPAISPSGDAAWPVQSQRAPDETPWNQPVLRGSVVVPNAQPTNAIAPPNSGAAAPGRKADLRYDGKTFNEWRDMLTNELSTEKRIEAIKALAAFGRAGYAKEASEAILNIAGEYDFYTIKGNATPEGKLKDVIQNELAPDSRTQSMAKYWVPDIIGRLANDPEKWKWLAIRLLGDLKTDDPATVSAVEQLTKNSDADLRFLALRAIVTSDHLQGSGKLSDKTQQLLASALQSKNPEELAGALNSLVFTPPNGGAQSEYNPALASLALDSNTGVQLAARNALKYLPKEDAAKLVDKYTAVLKDDSRKADHVAAIRALGTLGTAAEPAVTQLEHIFPDERQDLASRVAAAFAIDRIEGGTRCRDLLSNVENSISDEKAKSQFIHLTNEETHLQNR